jgi:predicted ATPase/class 3 adenylate cyclase
MRFCGNCGLRLLSTGMLKSIEPIPEQESTNQLGELVGADLLDRFRQAGLEAAGQRRRVTVVFVDLSGYTHLSEKIDSEQLYELVQQCTKMFANDVYKYDGIVDKFTGDGLMALFGAPIAHENNAELAIRATLDMQTDLAVLSAQLQDKLGSEIKAHIGLHSGHVVVGGVGSNLMMNYTAIGDVVNLASRIETAATADMILVSDAVYRQVRNLFDFEAVEPLRLKGVARPVTAHRVLGTKINPGSMRGIEGLYAPMIGRDGELERLQQTVNAMISEKTGRFVAVSGEAGIGKSRLISEFKSFLSQLPVQVAEGYSLVYRKGVAYWIFQDLLLRLLEVDAETPKVECQSRLRGRVTRALPDQVDEILPYLEHLLSLPLSDPKAARRIEYLAADQLRQQIFLAVRELLLAETRQKPVVLIFEDLHWADNGSLELLDFLLELALKAPLVIVAVSRSFTDAKLAEIKKRASDQLRLRFTDLSLKNLSPDQSDRLLSQLLAIYNMPESLRNHIVQRAAGIPLYIEEILRMLIDQNLLKREEGHWQFIDGIDLNTLGVPDTLEGLILTRFDHLELFQRHVLKVASVIGRAFTRSIIFECLPSLTNDEINRSFTVLLEREFILPDPSPGGEYMFKHLLVSDTIYSTLLKRERKELHGKVAETIEKLFTNRLDEQIDVLARHYFWSEYQDRALHYLILAGQKAARNYNTGQAQNYFEDALSLLPQINHSNQQALQVYIGLGDALALAGDYPKTRATFERAVQVLAGDKNASAEAASSLQRKIAMTYERQGDYDQALACLGAASQALLQTGLDSSAELAQILNDTGWIHFRRSNLDEAEKFLTQAKELAEKAARLDIISSVYNRLGGVYYQQDHLKQAREFVVKSIAIREEIGDVLGVARSYNNLGNLGWKLGSWDEALANFKRSAELQARLGDVEGIIELNSNLGLLQIDRGFTDEARQYLEDALRRSEQIGYYFHVGLSNHHMSVLLSTLGEWSAALEYGLRSETIFKSLGEKANLVDVYINLGVIYLGLNDLPKATNYGEQALALLAEFVADEETEVKGCTLRLLGDVALAMQDTDKAQKLYHEAELIFDAVGNRLERGRLLMSKARLAAAQSRRKLAKSCLLLAQKLFEQLGARLDLYKLDVLKTELASRK